MILIHTTAVVNSKKGSYNEKIDFKKELAMKKLIITAIIVLASSNVLSDLTWSTDNITLSPGKSATVQLINDKEMGLYWVDATDLPVECINITPLHNAGGDADVYQYSTGSYAGWWWLESLDMSHPFTSVVGAQYDVTFINVPLGTYTITADYYGSGDTMVITDTLQITLIPEPITISLLATGALFLRRRR